ncbi:MAG: WD40 repeat domain-containing protein [Aggregatilineales bacterium]
MKLWDADSGQCLATLQGHMNQVSAVAFCPDGTRIASGGGDNTVRIWDIA